LLLIPDAGGRGEGILSGKVFEYLAAARPILALVPTSGAAARLLSDTGAGIVVDPADIPSIVASKADDNYLSWGICSDVTETRDHDSGCSVVLKYGMKRDFNSWLASLGAVAPVRTLAELRAWNTAHQKAGAIKYGQALLDISDEMDVTVDRARYQADRAKDLRLAAQQGIDAALAQYQLDAILFPGASGASIAARPGYPTVIVPFRSSGNAYLRLFETNSFTIRPQGIPILMSRTTGSMSRAMTTSDRL